MAFPRQFNKQVRYLQIPSGEIEIATSEALKTAYKCGLVDLRTPVRAFGTHAWQTMQEAAEIDMPSTPSIVSFAPVAMSAPPPELEEAMTRQSRVDVDPKELRPSRRGAYAFAAVVAACAVCFTFGRSPTMKQVQSAAGSSMADTLEAPAATVTPVTVAKHVAPAIREEQHASERYDGEKFSKDQLWKLQNLDFITRFQRPKSAIVKPLVPNAPAKKADKADKSAKAKLTDPFAKSGKAGDPLDGTL